MRYFTTMMQQAEPVRGRGRRTGMSSCDVVAFLVIAVIMLGGCRAAEPQAGTDITDAETPPALARQVSAMMPQLERLSGLDQLEELRVRTQSRDDARAYVEVRLEQELPAELADGVRRVYIALGLIPDTLDLSALLLDLYTEQVLGYYDPRTRTLYVVDDADAGSLMPVLAHELVHALQDQHTNLDSLVSRERGNDRQTAAHAAMEGHAMMVMFALLAEQAAGQEVDPAALPSPATELGPALAVQNEQFPVFRRAPAIVQETLLFPYVSGADFVHQLWRSQQPQARYPAPIGSLLPQSTAQVMRPLDQFIQRRTDPAELRFDIPATALVVYENTLGQLETSIFLARHLGPTARSFAEGWTGDRFVLIDAAGPGSDDHADVVYWISVWDSTAAAERFADAVRRTAQRRAGRSIAVHVTAVDGRPAVAVTDAPAAVEAAAFPGVSIQTP